MFRNYLKTALRSLGKQRLFTSINIGGLAVGIACCLLIVLFVREELSFDTFHQNADRIYRTSVDLKFGEMEGEMAVTPAPFAFTSVADFPEVVQAARLRSTGSYLVKVSPGDNNIEETEVVFADKEVFEVFTFEVIEGDPISGLAEPNTLVLSKSRAERYFSGETSVGKTLILNDQDTYKVVAVIEDVPSNSQFQFDLFLSMEGREEAKETIWLSHNFHSYLLLKEGADADALEAKFPAMIEQYAGPQVKQFLGIEVDEWEASGNRLGYHLQPITDVYLRSDAMYELGPTGDITYVYIFSLIALFILFIACINFMNLSTARSANRAREVGVRKVLGALRSNLINQFLIESILIGLSAFVLALILAEIALPFFNNLADKNLFIPWTNPFFLPIVIFFGLIVGTMAGIYPSFYLSGFRPIQILKGKLSQGSQSKTLRSSLVVFQFLASIVLVVCTLVVREQLSFIQNKKLGFNKEQVLILRNTYTLEDQIQVFKQRLLQDPNIAYATISGYMPVQPSNTSNTVFWPRGEKTQERSIIMNNWTVDFDYVPTLGLEILEGRDFSLDFPTDSQAVILNEAAIASWGFEDPIGQTISTFSGLTEDNQEISSDYTIIGVVQNFHFESLKQSIAPLGLLIGNSTGSLQIRMKTDDISQTLSNVESLWAEFAPNQPLDYEFMDENFMNMYETESKLGKIFLSFAILAIFIACLGLFALASFMAEQRTKEIGIRKVLGARISQIFALLSSDFLKLVGISLLIAIPISWYFMNSWLQGFEYRTDISISTYVLAGIGCLLITLITISYQSLRAAVANPIHALKDE
ncbi:MAG: ABC transporter permease [Bacteroidota bacterium]